MWLATSSLHLFWTHVANTFFSGIFHKKIPWTWAQDLILKSLCLANLFHSAKLTVGTPAKTMYNHRVYFGEKTNPPKQKLCLRFFLAEQLHSATCEITLIRRKKLTNFNLMWCEIAFDWSPILTEHFSLLSNILRNHCNETLV